MYYTMAMAATARKSIAAVALERVGGEIRLLDDGKSAEPDNDGASFLYSYYIAMLLQCV